MKKTNTVPASQVKSFLIGAAGRGFSPEKLLEEVGIAPDFLHSSHERIPLQQYGQLLLHVWTTLDDEFGGFLDRPARQGFFALMNHSVMTAANLRKALQRACRLYGLISDQVRLCLEEKGDEAVLSIHFLSAPRLDIRSFLEIWAIVFIRWSSWLIDTRIIINRLELAYSPPEYADEYPTMFPCEIYFERPVTQLVFGRRYLGMPLAQSPQTLSDYLAVAPEGLLTQYKKDESLTAKVSRLIKASDGHLTLEETARQLHLSPPTLRRHLKIEGNSFQYIKDSLRRDTAIHYLLKEGLNVNDVAELMGFSEPSAFNRAFKNWTGYPPATFREQHSALRLA